MIITSTGLDLAGTVSGAINRALQAEGVCDSVALRFADCGARLPAAIPTRHLPLAVPERPARSA